MKHQSYKIKHDFLFDSEDTEIIIPQFDSNLSEKSELKVSDVLNTKDESSFFNAINETISNIIIIDDIGKCINPSSERYKQFIIRCVYRKLTNHGFSVYLQ